MSTGAPIPLERARRIAEDLVALLEPTCERIAIAGSIRRRKPTVHDIEIVALPRDEQVLGLWRSRGRIDALEGLLEHQLKLGTLALRDVGDGSRPVYRNGPKYKALVYRGISVDLFVVRPPAQWGVIFALRTGPGDWNKRLVSECQRYLRRVQDGQVWVLGKPVATPEEEDFFEVLGQPWVPPEDRCAERVEIRPR
jgi:DNA polymerase (family 10)